MKTMYQEHPEIRGFVNRCLIDGEDLCWLCVVEPAEPFIFELYGSFPSGMLSDLEDSACDALEYPNGANSILCGVAWNEKSPSYLESTEYYTVMGELGDDGHPVVTLCKS